MWLQLPYGFYSVVSVRDQITGELDPAQLLVRGRAKDHMESLRERFPSLKTYVLRQTPNADYHWRMQIPKATWTEIIAKMSEQIMWDNFKTEAHRVAPGKYVACLHSVWSIFQRLQE